jgi:hypothetical protein
MKRALLVVFVLVCAGLVAAVLWWPDERSAVEQATAQVVGVVVDAAGQAVVGATVTAAGLEASTDGEGRFVLAGVEAGRVAVRASAAGYVEWDLPDDRLVQAEVDGPPLKLVLTRPARLRGVLKSAGQPLPQVVIGVAWLRWQGPAGELPPRERPGLATTDAAGRFELTELPPGVVRVWASTPTGEAARELTLSAGAAQEVALEVAAVRPAVAVQPGEPVGQAAVAGQVLAPDGTPADQAIVVVSGPGVMQQLRVDGEGRFRVDLPPAQRRSCTAVAVSSTDAPSASVSMTAAQPLVLRLGLGGRVLGSVRERSGAVLAGARIFIDDAQIEGPLPEPAAGGVAIALSQADGSFEIGPLRPGRYRLRAEVDRKPPGLTAHVAVASGGRSRVEIVLGNGAMLKGRVTARGDGHPLAGAHVSVVEPGTASTRSAVADSNGSFEIAGLAPGRHTLTAHVEGYGRESVSGIDIPSDGEVRRDIQLDRGEHLAFEGIGASLRRTPAGIEVGWLAEGSPATAAGLQAGDVLRAVDGQPLDEQTSVPAVVERIRGEAGTSVTIEYERVGQGRQSVTIARRRVVTAPHGLPPP